MLLFGYAEIWLLWLPAAEPVEQLLFRTGSIGEE
jgi:hypothetical protein